MSDTVVTLKINANGQAAIAAVEQVKSSVKGMGDSAKQGGQRAAEGLEATSKSARAASDSVNQLTGFVKGLVGAIASIQGARALIQMADQAANLDAKLRIVTSSQVEFARAQADTFAIAQRTSTALGDTVNLYSRMAQATRDLGVSQTQIAQITETINQAFVVSGSTAAEASNAIIQLSQGLAAGALRGEEFNSVNEQGPRIMQALAASLGVTRGELRGLAMDGKLTSQVILDALGGEQAEKIAEDFSKIPLTVERAMTQLRNSVLQYVGDADKSAGISRQLAEAIQWVSQNFDKVVPVITAAVVALTGWLALSSPLGIFVTAVAGLVAVYMDLADSSDHASEATLRYVESVNAATEANSANSVQSVAVLANLYNETQQRLELAKAALLEAQAKAAIGDWFFWTIEDREAAQEAQANVDALNASIAGLEAKGGAAVAGGVGDFVKGLFSTADAAGKASIETDKATESTKKKTEADRIAAQTEREIEQATNAAAAAYLGYMQAIAPVTALEMEHAAALEEIEEWHAIGAISVQRYGELKALANESSEDAIAALNKERDVLGQLNDEYAGQYKAVALSRRELAGYQAGVEAAARAQKIFGSALDDMPGYLDQVSKQASDAATRLYDIGEALAGFGDDDAFQSPILKMIDGVSTLTDEIALLKAEMEKLPDGAEKAFKADTVEKYGRAIDRINTQIQIETVGGYKALLGAAQAFTKEGSKGFQAMEVGMAALSIVQDVLALKAAVTAVLTQGQGEPYSAFARMAAMAAAVAPFLASIGVTLASLGGGGGGFTDTAGQRQGAQGTGTVLGDADAKSESIANAVEITADATSELVGINRGMLRALIQLQDQIGNAAGMLARGVGDAEFSALPQVGGVGAALRDPLGNGGLLGGLLGGSSDITDQGIVIFGGALMEILENISVGAYQEVQSRSWIFGGRRTSEEVVDVTDELGTQFQLIIDSIVDTVREGALALGMVPEEIEAALATYQQEEIRISLMDLTAEEQQAELEAVFGQIFDGLAGHVVPFIAQFQQVGEGLGETLIRVATSVQVVQESMRYLGLAIDETDPEKFAQISVALIEAAGGIEEFVSGMMAFSDAFAPASFRFEAAQSALTEAFEEAGLVIPETRDGMWELMQSLDATTEQGREQIATLLRLAGVADQYYDGLEDQAQALLDQAQAMQDLAEYSEMLNGIVPTGLTANLRRIRQEYQQHLVQLNRLAVASGRAGASDAELADAHYWYSQQVQALADELIERARSLVEQLRGGGAANDPDGAGGEIGAINEVSNAVDDRYQRELDYLKALSEWLDRLTLSELSPLTPSERLSEAQALYQSTLTAAQGGDVDALANLQAVAQAYLQEAQGFYGGVGPYEDIFSSVLETLRALVDAGPQQEPTDQGTPVYGGPVTVDPGEGWAEQSAADRILLAAELTEVVRDIAGLTNASVVEVMAMLGYSLDELVADLGINLGELTTETTGALVDLARSLGLDLDELSAELGIDLGKLTDIDSPVYQALDQALNGLSPEIRDELQPYLDAITNATNEADANAAIADAEAAINAMPAGIRDLLAPFFSGVDSPVDLALTEAIEQTQTLVDIEAIADDMLQELTGIGAALDLALANLRSLNDGSGFDSYAIGTGYVPRTGLANIHQGELIMPAAVNAYAQRAGLQIGPRASNEDVVVELRALKNELALLRQERNASAGNQGATLERIATGTDGTRQAMETSNDIQRERARAQ